MEFITTTYDSQIQIKEIFKLEVLQSNVTEIIYTTSTNIANDPVVESIVYTHVIEVNKSFGDDLNSRREKKDLIETWLSHAFEGMYLFLTDRFEFEVEKQTYPISKLTRALEELYPYEYKQIQKAKSWLKTNISENLRELRSDLPPVLTRVTSYKDEVL